MQHLALLFGSEAVGRPCVKDFQHAGKTADQLLAVLTSYFASYILIDQTMGMCCRPSVLKPQQSSSLLILCIHGFGCAPARLQMQRCGCGLRQMLLKGGTTPGERQSDTVSTSQYPRDFLPSLAAYLPAVPLWASLASQNDPMRAHFCCTCHCRDPGSHGSTLPFLHRWWSGPEPRF